VDVQVWLCEPTDAAIVLGSRQTPDVVDLAACRAAGLEVVRRRSGGGVVLLRPGAVAWVDLVVPHGVAPDDVRGSMRWAGERWAAALEGSVDGRLTVHTAGMVVTPWSELVCFAGLGPGEVLLDGDKLVGLSQRRTRHGLRIQGTVHRRDLVAELPGLLAGPLPAAELASPAVLPSADAGLLADRLAASL
jgi:lipoate-protein ligase A